MSKSRTTQDSSEARKPVHLVSTLANLALGLSNGWPMGAAFLKRAFDLILSSIGLLLFLPFSLPIAALIKLGSRGPVFYRGVRVGRFGKLFRIFKFRTMVVDADKIGGPSTAEDDPRVTRMGTFLRRHKLDELPQLMNVLRGDMSLVGPRPEVPQEVELYTEEERRLLTVNPGITDWSSIKFRNEAEILKGSRDPHQAYREKIRPEKIRLGLEYAMSSDFYVDLKIILATLAVVLGRSPEAVLRMSEISSAVRRH
jgi:lipopolysaccharide/colanic/teichoic acid biosynthesis glycosyltransferase